ncbi:peptidase M50 [Actinotalea ferrariae CF5-4]|uniref:Peptidase M50 n=1 Tax=Actinotalea ferrariae CF5-4 TaxID=948458 RepID=A0A021VTV0_9CELL|nr:site-2 protease family protein [Actinotalea ferrariae]EYR64624.1 peptidase M50 [Actinotalea ferrariae CF5-4]
MRATGRDGGTRGWVVARVAGAPVVVSPGWVLAAAVLTYLFAPTVRGLVAVSDVGSYVVAGVFVLLLLASVFLHELAHALMARRVGVPVQELAVTLLGGHTRMGAAAPSPGSSALVAVSGPVVNLVLGAVAWLLAAPAAPGGVAWLVLSAAALANVFVGAFNLVPGLPLDGGRVLEALVWRVTGDRVRGTVVAGWVGRLVAVGVLAWMLLRPLLQGVQVSLLSVVWAALVGAFLWSGADQAVRAARSERTVEALVVARLMRPAVGVPARGTVLDLDTALALADPGRATAGGPGQDGPPTHAFLQGLDGAVVGVVDATAVAAVPPALRATTPLSAVATPIPAGAVVPLALSGRRAVEVVAAVARLSPVLAVVDGSRPVGVLHPADVARALRR